MRVNENVRRVRQTIETRMFSRFSVVLQLVFVHLSNNIFMNTATNVNNIKKIKIFFHGFQIWSQSDSKCIWEEKITSKRWLEKYCWLCLDWWLLILLKARFYLPLRDLLYPSESWQSVQLKKKKMDVGTIEKRISPVSWTQLFFSSVFMQRAPIFL